MIWIFAGTIIRMITLLLITVIRVILLTLVLTTIIRCFIVSWVLIYFAIVTLIFIIN